MTNYLVRFLALSVTTVFHKSVARDNILAVSYDLAVQNVASSCPRKDALVPVAPNAKARWNVPRSIEDGKPCAGPPWDDLQAGSNSAKCTYFWDGFVHRPECYTTPKFHFALEREEKRPQKPEGRTVALTIMGELQRVDNRTTISEHVVKPISSRHRVIVFMCLQAKRYHTPGIEWHKNRFHSLPSYSDEEEVNHAQSIARRFIDAGAHKVLVNVYNLVYFPSLMPSIPNSRTRMFTPPQIRFRSSYMSYVLHCLTRSFVLGDLKRWAHDHPEEQFDTVIEVRGDAYWARPIPALETLAVDVVHLKKCMSWKGYNDKFAVIPFQYADIWMDLLRHYYNDTVLSYWNSEIMMKLLAEKFSIPVNEHATAFATMDYNWWAAPEMNGTGIGPDYGCFPRNYYHPSCFSDTDQKIFASKLCAVN